MSLIRRLEGILSVGGGFLCYISLIPLWLPWSKSSTQTFLSTPMIPTQVCDELDKGWKVHHYSFSSGVYSWGTFGTTACLSLWWDPPLDDIMSYLTSTSIQWGVDPQITSHKLTEIHYLFFWISCHSIWPISHLHTIPTKRCAFLYALVTNAPMSFPTIFIRSLVKVWSSSIAYCLFFHCFYS